MNIVIPMAGQGERFSKSDFRMPKPLIQVAEKAMYRHAVDGLPLEHATQLIFIVLKNAFSDQLISDIKQHYSHLKLSIQVLDSCTRGQAETVLKCQDILDFQYPTLVHNCDTAIIINTSWENIINSDDDGAIVIFDSDQSRWSYVRLDDQGEKVIEMREKQVISSHATTGTYFFKDTKIMCTNIQRIMHENRCEQNEYYLSTVYQIMIENGQKILPIQSSSMFCFGTPQDLVDSMNHLLLKTTPEFIKK